MRELRGHPAPRLAHFFVGQRNGLETQRKPLGLAVVVSLVVLFVSAGIEFGRVVDGKVCCVHIAWPLTLVYVVTLAPYCPIMGRQ